MSGNITIDRDLIERVEVKIGEMYVLNTGKFDAVSDDTKEVFKGCITQAHAVGEYVSETVRSYNKFLNDLATAFEEKDKELSKVFGAIPSVSTVEPKSSNNDKNASDDYFS